MSPEIYNNQKYNSKTDVWSIGVIIFYLLTNQTIDFKFEFNIEKLNLIKDYKYTKQYIDDLHSED